MQSSNDPSCKGCGATEETALHILRDCTLATQIWKQLLPVRYHKSFFAPQLRTWFMMNWACPTITWSTLFATALWWLWRWRNTRSFKDPSFEPRRPCDFIRYCSKEISQALQTSSKIDILPWREVLIRWSTVPEDWIKLHVDGTSRQNPGRAGEGACLGVFLATRTMDLQRTLVSAHPSMRNC